MAGASLDHWLAETRRFWDVDSAFEAKYRRICSSPSFDATTDEAELQRLWDAETAAAVPRILEGVPIQRDWVCVEIGCGIGRLLKPIARRCRRVVGVDLSEPMVRMGRAYLSDVTNAEILVNDGRSIPSVADGSVDFVYSHLLFQHITLFEVVDAYLAEIARVLKPGGYCRIQNWRDARRPAGEMIKDWIRPLLGQERYRSSRLWTWSEGKRIRFGGVVFHPRAWRRRLQRFGLTPIATQLGVGHDYWMWTTSVRS